MSDQFGIFERLWRRPQGVWARRALFQIHLWAGIGVGIYLLLISVTGSLLVFRVELHNMFSRPPVTVTPVGEYLSDEQLKAAALRAFPGYKVTNIWKQKRPEQTVEIWLDREERGTVLHRIFDPYTGKNLGYPDPAMVRFIVWLAASGITVAGEPPVAGMRRSGALPPTG